MIDTIDAVQMIGPNSQTRQICQDCRIWEENQNLRRENTGLRERVRELETECGKLKRCLAHYEDTRTTPLRRRRRRRRSEIRFPGRPRGCPGTTRPRPKPDLVIQAGRLDECPECGYHLGEPVLTKHRIVEELPDLEPVKVVGYEEDHYLCAGCDCEIVARHPDCPPSGVFGKNVYVQTTLGKFEERLPYEKIRTVLKRQGLEISVATALELLDRTSRWLRPEYEKILAQVRASGVVYTDQTGIGVDGKQQWIWDFITDTETVYAIRPTKGRVVLDEILGKGWDGILVCDGLSSHHSFTENIQRCWVHILNEAKELVEKKQGQEDQKDQKGQKGGEDGRHREDEKKKDDKEKEKEWGRREAEALCRGLHRIYDRLKEALEKDPPPEERKRLAGWGRRALRYWINKQYKDAEVRGFAEKIKRAYPYLFTAVTHPGVELHNNRSELGLRELVVQRKIIGTLRNEKGTRIYETLATLLATWKQRGLDPGQALSNALSQSWKPKPTKRSS